MRSDRHEEEIEEIKALNFLDFLRRLALSELAGGFSQRVLSGKGCRELLSVFSEVQLNILRTYEVSRWVIWVEVRSTVAVCPLLGDVL